ncbi:MAG: glycogen operon protein GlgX homolog [Ignavibacteriaceae bacterium]|nr:MAG: glycogen operon protein GlgX homolog [Ignavibacteriaceae bacterium]
MGATVTPDKSGVNFCVYSRNATMVELLLFDSPEAEHPADIIRLNILNNRSYFYWHCFVQGIGPGQVYAYRVYGPYKPEQGLKFDPEKVLVDPYSRLITDNLYKREAARKPGSNLHCSMRSVVVDTTDYDWEGDVPLNLDRTRTVIYELHVKGFTANPNSGVSEEHRGTFRGLIDKIPYLKDLGITAVELLPIQQFDPHDVRPPLVNYWGYNPFAFFAPHRAYSSDQSLLGPVNEFRDMVKAFHKAGIEVILDVVFNHTAEGDETGPVLSYRGFENNDYYIFDENNRYRYANYTGCGNTLNANHSVVKRMIIDSLKYWVSEMHVDGFRFDLASVFSRGADGEPLEDPPILWQIESDPVLAGTKLIAEAWDAGGLYQVGSFAGYKWAEWNGKFRDDVRRFARGDKGLVPTIVRRIAASPDIYPDPLRNPARGINFVTCHDGFTLNDLVSYNLKHNEANRENNRDGANENFSWNCGVEGPTSDHAIEKLRKKMIKNFLVYLFTSQGTPLLLMGDEVRKTQLGNNNAYCHDNAMNWFDWSLLHKHHDIHHFAKKLIHFTQSHHIFSWCSPWMNGGNFGESIMDLHGIEPFKPDLSDHSLSIAYTLKDFWNNSYYHFIINSYWAPLDFMLPHYANMERWEVVVDTAEESPKDFHQPGSGVYVEGVRYLARERSFVILHSAMK